MLESKGVATPEDLREDIRVADLADGEEDGRVDLDNLRGTTE